MPQGFRKDGSKLGFQLGHSLAPSGINHRLFGKKSINYKHGKTKIKNFCLDCNKQLSVFYVKRCRSCAQRNRYKEGRSSINIGIRGCDNPNYKGGKPKCLDCNKEINRGYKRCLKCKGKLALNPNWQGGISFEPYPLGWNKTFKEQIRFRDGYKCQMCGVSESECRGKLHVHHIDYVKVNLNVNNLISLCGSCHSKTHWKRDYWVLFFKPFQERFNNVKA